MLPSKSQGSSRLLVFLTSITLVALLVGVVGVFYWLPSQLSPSTSAASKPEDGEETDSSATERASSGNVDIGSLDIQQLAQAREAAEHALREFLRQRNVLDEKAASSWGGERYSTALENASAADDLFQKQQFERAAQTYQIATTHLDALLDFSREVLEESLTAGAQALEQSNPSEARAQYTLALQIDSNNEAAREGLAQAEIIQNVQNLLESGLAHEQRSDFAFAHVDYSEAVALAPHNNDARTALERVEARIIDENFEQAMSDGLNALHQSDLNTARSAIKLALTFKPNSPEAEDVLAQINETVRLRQIATYKKKAKNFEDDEEWKKAAEQYVAILAIAPNVVFAKNGKERSLRRAELSHKLDIYLNEPGRLASQQSYDDATTLLKAANQIDSKGPKLKSQVSALETLLKAAGTPVSVHLKSDNLTDVLVYKLGALGKFESMELDLRPGKYTIVGTRNGYRDVRKELVVAADRRPEPLVILCEEKI